MDTYWYRFGYIAEGRGWHERALALLEAGDVPDSIVVVDALHGHGVLALQQMDLETGTQALERSLAIAHRLGDLDREARESNSLGIARREAGDLAGARHLIEQSLALARLIRHPGREATALTNVVHLHMDAGDYSAAVEAARRAIAADRALDDPWGVAVNQSNLVVALLHAEGPEPALAEFRRVAPDAVALGDVELSIDVLETAAAIWAGLGQPERAAGLLGAAEEQRRIASMPRPAQNEQYLERFLTPARQGIAEATWEQARARGASLTVEQALADALRYEVASNG
jgi:tetratricopeptide (TPR) repeat protein